MRNPQASPEAPTSEGPRKGSPGHRQQHRLLTSSATLDKVAGRPCAPASSSVGAHAARL